MQTDKAGVVYLVGVANVMIGQRVTTRLRKVSKHRQTGYARHELKK